MTITFVDAEIELLSVLVPAFPSYRFSTSLPGTVTSTTIRVKRISGANRDLLVDRPVIDIDVYDPAEATASSVARAIQAALVAYASKATQNGVIQRAATISGPRWLPTENQTLTRYGATYEVFIRAA